MGLAALVLALVPAFVMLQVLAASLALAAIALGFRARAKALDTGRATKMATVAMAVGAIVITATIVTCRAADRPDVPLERRLSEQHRERDQFRTETRTLLRGTESPE